MSLSVMQKNKIVITGANGFIGKNLTTHFRFREEIELVTVTRDDDDASLVQKLRGADCIFHLAGVNRPSDVVEYDLGNTLFAERVITVLESQKRPYKLIFTSSTQALQDNPYGKSKLAAENILQNRLKNGELIICRLPGVFGKWCRPNYNSVVATFCYNIAKGLPVEIRDPLFELQLVYVDDVIKNFLRHVSILPELGKISYETIEPVYNITLGKLAESIESFKNSRNTLLTPSIGDKLQKALYSTYLTYLPEDGFSYPLQVKTDNRGYLFEWIKSPVGGQIFISSTLPGITRGNHFHHTKTEKFLVIQGEGLIQFRSVNETDVIEYAVSGTKPEVVDIPPGYTHNITNTGKDVMLTLFWANEIFDAEQPDTFFVKV